MTETQEDKLTWVREDAALVERLDAVWSGWDDPGADGLVATLDQQEDWSGWGTWADEDKRSYLQETLDAWYPPEGGEGAEDSEDAQAGVADRIGWVHEDTALVARLDAVWAGWDDPGEDGLEATLDQQEDWSGWETWSGDDKRSYLAQTLDRWYPPAPGEQAAVENTSTVEQTPDAEATLREAVTEAQTALSMIIADNPELADLSEEARQQALAEALEEFARAGG